MVNYSVSIIRTDSSTTSRERGVTVLVRTAVVPGLYRYCPSLEKTNIKKTQNDLLVCWILRKKLHLYISINNYRYLNKLNMEGLHL